MRFNTKPFNESKASTMQILQYIFLNAYVNYAHFR